MFIPELQRVVYRQAWRVRGRGLSHRRVPESRQFSSAWSALAILT